MIRVCACVALTAIAGQAMGQAIYSNYGGTASPTLIGLSTGATSRSGVAAPAGSEWSEVPFGSTSAGSTVSLTGAGPNFRLADDFTVPGGQSWALTSASVFMYRTGSADSEVILSSANIQIWSGRPGDVGSTVIFGDTATNRLLGVSSTNLFRTFASTVPAGGTATAPGTTRIVRRAELDLSGLVLGAGTYWIDYQVSPTVAGAAIFNPGLTPADGARSFVTGMNARQLTATAWADMIDTGNPAAEPDVAMDLPFILNVPTPGALAVMGLGGLLVARRRR